MTAVQTSIADTFDQWDHLVSDSFVPLQVSREKSDPFTGRMRSCALDKLSVVEVTAGSHRVDRTRKLIGTGDSHSFKLNLQLTGNGTLVQESREAQLRPGDLAVYDTHRPYTLDYEHETKVLVLMFAHDALHLPPEQINQMTAVRIAGDAGIGLMLSAFMSTLADTMATLSGPSGQRLGHNLTDLVTTMFESELDLERSSAESPRQELLARVRRYIDDQLGDPGLAPTAIAEAHFISTRHLHSLFQKSGTTVAGWIRTRRLENCRRDLGDPSLAHRSIGSIASQWGLVDAAHFSRIFRDAFGQSPSAFRAR